MKKWILLLLLCTCGCFGGRGQETPKFSYAVMLGTGLPMSKPSSTPFTLQVCGYYRMTEKWSAGIGTGLSRYEKTLIPLSGQVSYRIGRVRKFTPYAEIGAGYSFAPESDANGGVFLNPSFGVLYPLKGRVKLRLAAGYELQELKRLKKQSDPYFDKEFAEELSHHSLSFRVGLLF